MLESLRQWNHWGTVRYTSGLVTAVATVATVLFGIWTYHQAHDATALRETQDTVVFDIVARSGLAGVAIRDIAPQYADAMSAHGVSTSHSSVEDRDILSVLQRIAPSVTLVADKWHATGSEPLSDLRVFIQDVTAAIPQIPDAYKDRSLTSEEITELLLPLHRTVATIRLSAEEVRRLNSYADESNQAVETAVGTERNYTMPGVVRLIGKAFGLYFEYTQYERIAGNWSAFLSRDLDADESPVQRLEALINEQFLADPIGAGGVPTAVVVAAAVAPVGSASPGLSLAAEDGDCVGSGSLNVRFARRPGGYVIDWGRFESAISDRNVPRDIVDAAERLVELFESACVRSLSRVFRDASRIFGTDHEQMSGYIDEWNGVLARQAADLTLRVTISNVGPLDTFVRRSIRVGVGAVGSDDKILFTATADDDSAEAPEESLHLAIGGRTANTYTFQASLESDIGRRLLGVFTGELSYMRAGVIANLGGGNEIVYSPVVPFSEQARRQVAQEVDAVPIEF